MGSMEPNSNSVYEPEIDMNRRLRLTPTRRVNRLIIGLLLWLQPGGFKISNPRRSVDRKQQEYPPLREL
jgi:hypothetical protein